MPSLIHQLLLDMLLTVYAAVKWCVTVDDSFRVSSASSVTDYCHLSSLFTYPNGLIIVNIDSLAE